MFLALVILENTLTNAFLVLKLQRAPAKPPIRSYTTVDRYKPGEPRKPAEPNCCEALCFRVLRWFQAVMGLIEGLSMRAFRVLWAFVVVLLYVFERGFIFSVPIFSGP